MDNNIYSVLEKSLDLMELYRDFVKSLKRHDYCLSHKSIFDQYKESKSVAWATFECYLKLGYLDDDEIYNKYFTRLLKGGI